ncbi:InlB B-repeat-containing protein [Erysipelothrix sp. P66]|uniref:InlB B-repeat-containing protein n=1 Tax=Erysipelothrix sp. P66 TaxID=3141531 RepID=UPI00315C805D
MKNLRKHILSFVLVTMLMVNVVNISSGVKADYSPADLLGNHSSNILSPSYQVGFIPEVTNPSALSYPIVYELYFEYETGVIDLIDTVICDDEADVMETVRFKLVDNVNLGLVQSHILMVNKQPGLIAKSTFDSSNRFNAGFYAEGGTFQNGSNTYSMASYLDQLLTYDQNYEEPVRPGFTFVGWEMDFAGSGYMWNLDSQLVDWHEDLFAVWSEDPVIVDYSVSYDGNGALSGDVPNGTRVEENEVYTVLDTLPNLSKPGYTFDGWNTAQGGTGQAVQPNELFTVTEDTIFYAQWKKDIIPTVEYSVSYDANGADQGVVPNGAKVEENTVYKVLGNENDLILANHKFMGWNDKADGSGNHYDGEDTLTIKSDIVFYAQWEIQQKPIPTEPEVTKPEVTQPDLNIDEIQKDHPDGVGNVQSDAVLPSTGVNENLLVPIVGSGIIIIGITLVILKKKES